MQFRGITLKPLRILNSVTQISKADKVIRAKYTLAIKNTSPLSTGKMPKNSDSYWFTRCCDVILTTLLACSESSTSSSGNGLKLHKTRKQITCCFTG